MRLKLFTAESMPAAMKAVRDAMGAEAVIVDVQHGRRGAPVRVLAAIESEAPAPAAPTDLAQILRDHGTTAELIARLQAAGDGDLRLALARLLPTQAISLTADSRLLLVGLPGQGKTLTAARLAAQASFAGLTPQVVTLDAASAGGLAQIETLCALLSIKVTAADPDALGPLPAGGPLIIDSAGVSPYALADVERLARVAQRSGARPLWVQAAGGDAMEALDHAAVFASLGARGLLVSRLDACRRLGSLLELLLQGPVPLAGFSASPYLADPILPPDAGTLADRILPRKQP